MYFRQTAFRILSIVAFPMLCGLWGCAPAKSVTESLVASVPFDFKKPMLTVMMGNDGLQMDVDTAAESTTVIGADAGSTLSCALFHFKASAHTDKTHTGSSNIIGMDALAGHNALLLDFTDGKIAHLDGNETFKRLENRAFVPINSSWRGNVPRIELQIAGRTIKAALSTLTDGQLIVPTSAKLTLDPYSRNRKSKTKSVTYSNVPVKLLRHRLSLQVIEQPTATTAVIGRDLLKSFDWIIDFADREVYVRKNHRKVETIIDVERP